MGSTTSSLGSAFTPVALAFAVLRIGGPAIALGLVLTSGALARLLFLLLGGVLADRLPRRQVMLVADVARGFIQASVAALLLTGQAQVWELLAANVMTSVASSFFRPASTGLIAQAVGPEQLQQANALLSISGSTASVLGPALSGVLVATIGPGWAFAVDGASFFGSGAFLGRMGAL
ncbi:MAG: MFS transporter, partial [Candidatus Dormibacteria bacterium]